MSPHADRSFNISQQASGWYSDPTGRHTYRYWDGATWSNQVSDGGTAGVDPVDLDETTAVTPPAPGTQAPGTAQTTSSESPSGSVEVTQSSGGIGSAVILGVLVGALIVILVVITLINNADDESSTSTVAPGPTVTTLAPDTTATP